MTSTINYGVDIKTPSREALGIVLSRNCFIEGVGSDKLFTKGIPRGQALQVITLMSTFNGTIKLWMKREKRHVDVSYDNVENGFEETF